MAHLEKIQPSNTKNAMASPLASGCPWVNTAFMNTIEEPSTKRESVIFVGLMEAVAQRRDRESFARLFDHFAPRVRSYMLRLGTTPATADDLVQDVMLTVWRMSAQYDPRKAMVSTWIFTIARNRRIDILRRERRPDIDANDPALVPDEEPAPDRVLQQKQNEKIVRAALAELPEKHAQLLKLTYFQEMSQSEIAHELSLPLGTVKSRIGVAAAALRAKLMEKY
jgi:RNA polymerase sigma factor (sigma-70 family)